MQIVLRFDCFLLIKFVQQTKPTTEIKTKQTIQTAN